MSDWIEAAEQATTRLGYASAAEGPDHCKEWL